MDPRRPTVADVMSIDPIVVHVDASLDEADQLLRSTYIRGIPVVDGQGRLVGVIHHGHLAVYRFAYRAPPGTEPDAQTRSKAIATDPPPPRHSVARP